MGELDVTVAFSGDQALVLSDWLDRMLGNDQFDALADEDPAVWLPLYKLAGSLKTNLPDIFAAGYPQRLEVARQRLLARLGERPRRAYPRPAEVGGDREVSGWIMEDNVIAAFEYLSSYVGYRFDHLDETAVSGALEGTDDSDDERWFEYPLKGTPELTVRAACAVGSAVVTVVVRGGIDDVLAARIETVLDVLTTPQGVP